VIGFATAALLVATAVGTATLAATIAGRGGPRVWRAGLGLMAAGPVMATVALGRALWTLDLSLAYVADHARAGVGAPYRLAGLWGGASGSLLLLTALGAAVLLVGANDRATIGGAVATLLGFLVALQTLADPFDRLAIPAIAGGGLQPILEHPAMLYHPPIVYVGLVVLAVPALRTISAGTRRTVDDEWRDASRRWLLPAFVLLTAGLALGANWAYVELGWGGYWGWDPVENSVLVPWLVTLAALHRLRRPGPHGPSSAALVIAPWLLVLVGTTLTRSGAGPSVHAFADDADLGWILLGVIVLSACAAGVAVARLRPLDDRADLLTIPVGLGLAGATVVFAGVLYPLPAPGSPSVSGAFYARLLLPLALVAVVGAGIPFLRRPRPAWPTAVAHVGFAVLVVGVLGSTQAESAFVALAPGESVAVGAYRFRHEGVAVVAGPAPETEAVQATLRVERDEELVTTLRPELVAFPERGVLLAETALHSRPLRDIQVVLASASDSGTARYELAVRPLVALVWWGAALMTLGGAGSLHRRWRRSRVRSSSLDTVSVAAPSSCAASSARSAASSS
jgi:cytochrome c biogenesis factor